MWQVNEKISIRVLDLILLFEEIRLIPAIIFPLTPNLNLLLLMLFTYAVLLINLPLRLKAQLSVRLFQHRPLHKLPNFNGARFLVSSSRPSPKPRKNFENSAVYAITMALMLWLQLVLTLPNAMQSELHDLLLRSMKFHYSPL